MYPCLFDNHFSFADTEANNLKPATQFKCNVQSQHVREIEADGFAYQAFYNDEANTWTTEANALLPESLHAYPATRQ